MPPTCCRRKALHASTSDCHESDAIASADVVLCNCGGSANRDVEAGSLSVDATARANIVQRVDQQDDMAIVIEALLKAVRTIDVQAPVARFDVQESDMKAFRAVMASDVFEPYVGSQALFEIVSRPTGGVVEAVAVSAKSLVRAFPDTIDLRKTLVHGIAPFQRSSIR